MSERPPCAGDLGPYARVARDLALRDAPAVLAGIAAIDDPPAIAAETLRHHHLVRTIHALVPEDRLRGALRPPLAEALLRIRPVGRASIDLLVHAFAEVQEALAAAGVPVLLLKGFYLADRLYGGLAGRPQSDLDLLVRRRDFRRALRALAARGFARAGGDIHSRDLVRGAVKVDVHRFLRWAPALRVAEDELWAAAIDATAAGLAFRTLSDEHTIVALVVAAFENVGQGMARMKQLVDLLLLVRDVDARTDWDAFLARRERENLEAITTNVLALVLDVFDARAECPRLASVLDRRPGALVHGDRAGALGLLAAPRKARANLAWFGRVYPGSLAHYLAWFWYGGFPANLTRLGPAWLVSHLRLARELRAERG